MSYALIYRAMIRAGISLPALMHLMGHAQIQTHHGLCPHHPTGCLPAICPRRGSSGAAYSAVSLMKRLRLPLVHPLAEVFFAAVQSVTTSMSDSTKVTAIDNRKRVSLVTYSNLVLFGTREK